MDSGNVKRDSFSSSLAVFFATLGSAIGLGNIWRFPYLTGIYGGGAFLLTYALCIVFVGLPVMVSEFFIGRKTKKNAIGALRELKPGTYWLSIGIMGVVSSYLIMFFYSSVAGWVYSYIFKVLAGAFLPVTMESAQTLFSRTVTEPASAILWQAIAMAVVSVILISGVRKGIERVTKLLMPVLFILILVCDIRALTLPGAANGLKFLFSIDFSKLSGAGILTALGLAFFKLSLGMGTMITYGSYFTAKSRLLGTSVKVALSDTFVSILAGIAIFPAVFSFGMKPEAGPGLLFMTIPLVFSKLPFGSTLLAVFFILTSIAATTAMISIVEVPVAYLTEELKIPRKASVLINTCAITAIGSLAALSADKKALLGGVTILGRTFFELFDFVSSNILLPLGGFLLVLLTGYFVRREEVISELSNHGTISNRHLTSVYVFITRYIAPVLLTLVFLNSIGLFGL